MLKRISFLLLFTLSLADSFGQDPQLSQFYAAPMYLNPAFAGSALAPRVTLNYRNQWPALSANFVTTIASADTYLPNINSGVGIMVMSDRQFSNLRTTDVAGQYAYQLKINEDIRVRAGIQASYVNRSIDYFGLVFGDQLSNRGVSGPSLDPIASTGPRLNYADFSGGLLTYSDKFWGGVSVHHINRPNQSLTGGLERLPMRISVQGGIKIPLGAWEIGNGLGRDMGRERSISPTMMFRKQGKFSQLDAGVYLTYDPLTFGLWYRGIPLKQFQGINSHDALVVLVGYRQDNFSVGYSYDATVSGLGMATGGSHEISLSYTFEQLFEPKQRYPKRKKELACPKF